MKDCPKSSEEHAEGLFCTRDVQVLTRKPPTIESQMKKNLHFIDLFKNSAG
jgi:hypothetical protein